MAVSPFATAHDAVSTALLKVTLVANNHTNTTYIKATVQGQTSAIISVTDLGAAGGLEFYAALSANEQRWSAFQDRGARVQIPSVDARYRDTASSLLSMYLNTDRGLLPEYGVSHMIRLSLSLSE